MNIVLASDGGADRSGSAAGACVLRRGGGEGTELAQLVVYLGAATNNEAEICAGLLGFSLLSSERGGSGSAVHWLCDSEYVLKSATSYIFNWQRNGWKTADRKPVKNQGLWRAYLQLTSAVKITPEHVLGHSGHLENEICDTAVTWARAHGDALLAGRSGLYVGEDPGGFSGVPWCLIDGRPFLEEARAAGEDAVGDVLAGGLREVLMDVDAQWFPADRAVFPEKRAQRLPGSPSRTGGRPAAGAALLAPDEKFAQILNSVSEAQKKAALLSEVHGESAALSAELKRLLSKYRV